MYVHFEISFKLDLQSFFFFFLFLLYESMKAVNETFITVCGIDEYCYPPFFFFCRLYLPLLMKLPSVFGWGLRVGCLIRNDNYALGDSKKPRSSYSPPPPAQPPRRSAMYI